MSEGLQSFAYLAALLFSAGCIMLVDSKYRIFLFSQPLRSILVLTVGVAFFLSWDLVGISLGIFLHGPGPYMTGVMLAPELPLEELVFLGFLCYLTMVMILGVERLLHHKVEREDDR